MKLYVITFADILAAMRHGWRKILTLTLIFTLIGAFFGFLLSRSGDHVASGSADELVYTGLPPVEESHRYYLERALRVYAVYSGARSELKTLRNDETVTGDQLDAINKLDQSWEQSYLQEWETVCTEVLSLEKPYCPEEFWEDELAYCESRLFTVSEGMAIDEVTGSHEFDEVDVTSHDYAKNIYASRIDWLKNRKEQLLADCLTMDQRLDNIEEKQGKLLEQTNQLALQVCTENYLQLHIKYKVLDWQEALTLWQRTNPEEKVEYLTVGIAHTFGVVYAKNALEVTTLFCMLTGLAVGVFAAVCRQGKSKQ